jgi:hypothetical protein
MRLLYFFHDPDWARFRRLPIAVQKDTFALSTIHLGIEAAIAQHMSDVIAERASSSQEQREAAIVSERQLFVLRESKLLRGEIQLSLLSTIQGNALVPVQWGSIEAHQACGILGAIAVRRYRVQQAANAVLSISSAGYSPKLTESEAQFVAVAADAVDLADWFESGREFASICKAIYRRSRDSLIRELPPRSLELLPRERRAWKAWFRALQPAFRLELLNWAEAIAKQWVSTERSKSSPATLDETPAGAKARSKYEHPVALVPLPAFVELERRIESDCLKLVRGASLSGYEIGRLSGQREILSVVVQSALEADCKTVARAIVHAAACTVDQKFPTFGVSQALWERHDRRVCFAHALAHEPKSTLDGPLLSTKESLELIQVNRESVSRYFQIPTSERVSRMHALLQGSILLRAIAYSPKLEALLVTWVGQQLDAVVREIKVLAAGELWEWPRQREYVERMMHSPRRSEAQGNPAGPKQV